MWEYIVTHRPNWVSRFVAWGFHRNLYPGWGVKHLFDLMIGEVSKK